MQRMGQVCFGIISDQTTKSWNPGKIRQTSIQEQVGRLAARLADKRPVQLAMALSRASINWRDAVFSWPKSSSIPAQSLQRPFFSIFNARLVVLL